MGSRLTTAQRERLPKSDFACPVTKDYPIPDPSHVANARTYYRREYTVKCKGGKNRICSRAKKFGMLNPKYPGSKGWRKWCK